MDDIIRLPPPKKYLELEVLECFEKKIETYLADYNLGLALNMTRAELELSYGIERDKLAVMWTRLNQLMEGRYGKGS